MKNTPLYLIIDRHIKAIISCMETFAKAYGAEGEESLSFDGGALCKSLYKLAEESVGYRKLDRERREEIVKRRATERVFKFGASVSFDE